MPLLKSTRIAYRTFQRSARCEELVLREIEDATEAEKEDIHTLAEAMITKAECLLPA